MQFVKDFNNQCKVLECVSTLDFLFNSEMIISMFFSMYNDFRYMKFIYLHCGEETNWRDPRS